MVGGRYSGEGFLYVADLRPEHRLRATCPDCRHQALIDARWLQQRCRPDETIARLCRDRLRCTACGRLGVTWWTIADAAGGPTG